MKRCFIGLTLFWSLFVMGQDKELQFILYFEHDQYQLAQNQRLRIDSLLALPNKDLYDVHISGFTKRHIGQGKERLIISKNLQEEK